MKRYVKLFETFINDSKNPTVVNCTGCPHHWDFAEGGDHPYECHKCGTDNSQAYGLEETR